MEVDFVFAPFVMIAIVVGCCIFVCPLVKIIDTIIDIFT